MFIEAVSICVGYSDYLAWTIAQNKLIFNNYVIVTSEEDYDTWKLCQNYNVKCIQTNIFKDGYNKGAAINLGLQHLTRKDWVVHLDGDIYMPSRTRYFFDLAKLDIDKIYGIDRLNIIGFENWINYLSNPKLLHAGQIYLHHDIFPIGTRIVKTWKEPEFTGDLGWIPIGFFQMWNESNGIHRIYDEQHKDFARGDMNFACQWPREKRELIPEIVCFHLMAKNEAAGINWKGRCSERFGLNNDKKMDKK